MNTLLLTSQNVAGSSPKMITILYAVRPLSKALKPDFRFALYSETISGFA